MRDTRFVIEHALLKSAGLIQTSYTFKCRHAYKRTNPMSCMVLMQYPEYGANVTVILGIAERLYQSITMLYFGLYKWKLNIVIFSILICKWNE